MLRALDINRVSYKKIGSYGLRCQKNNVRFDMEIAHLDNLDNIYVVKFKRLAGEMQQYKEVSGKVLSNMNLSTNPAQSQSNQSNMAPPPMMMNYVY